MKVYGWCCRGGKQYLRVTRAVAERDESGFEFKLINAVPNEDVQPLKVVIPTRVMNKILHDLVDFESANTKEK